MKKIMLITVMLILIALPFFSGCITYDYGLISVTGVKGDIVYVEYPENWEYASSFSATVQVKNVGSSAGYLYVFHIDKKFIGPPCRNCDSLFRTANILSPGQIKTVTVTWNLPTGYTSLGKDYEGFIAVSHDDGTGGCSSCSLNDDVYEFIMTYGTSNVDYNVEIFTKDQDGKIIPECSVTINTIEGTIVETFITDTNGKCTLRLPKGEYSVIATKSGYTSESSLMEINQDSSFTIVLYTPDWKPYVPPKNKDIPGFELLLMFLAFIIIIIRNKTWGLKK